jgi:ATP-dependent Clp protease ATP-binding subunit ClpA
MFERFTADARQAVVDAQTEARTLGHDRIGCEHLLLGLSRRPGTPAADALGSLGAGLNELREAVAAVVGPCADKPDADALRVLGIDFDEVRRRAEETFGPGALERTRAGGRAFGTRIGAIPFTPRAKEALHLALRAAKARGDKAIGSEHVLLGIVDQEANVGIAVLAELRISAEALRHALDARLERDAA